MSVSFRQGLGRTRRLPQPGTTRRHGLPNYRIISDADDFVVMVSGTETDAQALKAEVAEVLAPMGLRQGFDFLGYRIQRRRARGRQKRYVYTYPAKKALASIVDEVRMLTRLRHTNPSLEVLLHRIKPDASRLDQLLPIRGRLQDLQLSACLPLWHRVVRWLHKKHPRPNWKQLRRRYLNGWWPTADEVTLFNPSVVSTVRYRYRGNTVPSPWPRQTEGTAA